jgi:hypothetical protein
MDSNNTIKFIKMKKIQPISIWQNGENVEATILNAYVVNDNLSNSATFYYSLLNDNLNSLNQGNLTMTGDDYLKYETNLYAYDWVAAQLKLTITGDYVPPVPTTTTTTTEAPVVPTVTETTSPTS